MIGIQNRGILNPSNYRTYGSQNNWTNQCRGK